MKRALGLALAALVVFAAVGALTFPTDAVVRGALDRIPLPDRMTLAFTSAHLRPNGLRLDDVHIVRADGNPAFDATSLRLRPSLWGFWRDRTGRPWVIAAETCQGTIEVTVEGTPQATPVSVKLEHVELGTCLPYVFRQIDAYGRVDGTFAIDVGTTDPRTSTGALQLRGAAWTPGGPFEDTRLRADAGSLEWKLADNRLEVTKLEATGQDFEATGGGIVTVVSPIDDSRLDLRIAITPGPTMPPLLRRYFDAIAGAAPDQHGTRTFRIQGALRDPRIVAAGRFP